jgi:uncharacterized protein YkwD
MAPKPGREAEMTAACGQPDAALAAVAEELASERVRGLGAPDADRASLLLRKRGEPHVRPRVVLVSTRGESDDASIQNQLGQLKHEGTRCGVAFARPSIDEGKEGNDLLVAIAIDALADLEPLPTRGRTGQWLTLHAKLHVPATGARLVIVGPRGLPRTVPTSIDRATGDVRARFALDRPGEFSVQLVADLAEGPRPLLEAHVFSDVAPPAEPAIAAAPGENAPESAADPSVTLEAMTAALRLDEALSPLRRDERLDALARAHVKEMKSSHAVAHDLGDGDLQTRIESAGLSARIIGENVARARSLVLAHRALYASPSHRMNLLRADYTHVGFAVVTDDDGDVYVCEVFAGGLH